MSVHVIWGLLALYVVASVILARWADRRFRDHARLPMQWGLNGRVGWFAPRRMAVLFGLVAGGLGPVLVAVMATMAPTPAHEAAIETLTGLMTFMCATGLAANIGYLWLVARWAR